MSETSFNCPKCHSLMTTPVLQFDGCEYYDDEIPCNMTPGNYNNRHNDIYFKQYLYKCKNKKCGTLIIRVCESDEDHVIAEFPSHPKQFDFSQYPYLQEISPTFVILFNEALMVEQLGYKQIAGPGYRKAIEFLVKDYVIKTYNQDSDEIKKNSISKMNLQQCINDYIDDVELKHLITGSYWLGNDQTHYYKKREEKDIKDLKEFILITMHFIEKGFKAKELISSLSSDVT